MSLLRKILQGVASALPRRVIRSPLNGEVYLERYYILGNTRALADFGEYTPVLDWLPFTLYLHHFRASDWERNAVHDHPWHAASLVLAGGYYEERPDPEFRRVSLRWRKPWSLATLTPNTFHRVTLGDKTAWTLFLIGDKRKSWGFHTLGDNGCFHPWRQYINGVSQYDQDGNPIHEGEAYPKPRDYDGEDMCTKCGSHDLAHDRDGGCQRRSVTSDWFQRLFGFAESDSRGEVIS